MLSIHTQTGKKLSPATVLLEMSLLSNFFDLARIEWGFLITENPCKDVRKPKASRSRDRRLTPREERAIYRYARNYENIELWSIIKLALITAMRQKEIISIHWEDILFNKRVVTLYETKNNTRRDVPLSKEAHDALVRLGVKSKGPVFKYTQNGVKTTLQQRLI